MYVRFDQKRPSVSARIRVRFAADNGYEHLRTGLVDAQHLAREFGIDLGDIGADPAADQRQCLGRGRRRLRHLGRAVEIEANMSDTTLYEGAPERLAKLGQELSAAERAIQDAEADWLQAAEALEALQGGEGS